MSPCGFFNDERSLTHADHPVNQLSVLFCVWVMSAYSDAVLAAQAALLARRQSRQKSPATAAGAFNRELTPAATAVLVTSLPAHLGWGSTAVTQHIRLCKQEDHRRERREIFVEIVEPTPHSIPKCSSLPKHVRHYPDVGIAALNEKCVPQYQLWLACRLLDTDGRGWLSTQNVQQQLTAKDAPLRLFGKRRLRQVLQRGNGRFWTWDKQQHRIWLAGISRIALRLGVHKLTGNPVLLPAHTLTNGIGSFKAHLYAAWHSGRRKPNPISRATQRQLLGVPERTQRHYEQRAGVKVTPNLAVGVPYSAENLEMHTWRRGRAVFQFVDKQGRLGKQNGRYLAWQLPNQYVGPHQQAARGRQRRINRQLIGLVHQGAQGNSDMRLNRRYFPHGAAAAQAIQCQLSDEVYWPIRHKHRYQLWSLFLN